MTDPTIPRPTIAEMGGQGRVPSAGAASQPLLPQSQPRNSLSVYSDMMPYTEQVLAVIQTFENGDIIALSAFTALLPELTRRQITSALHGLAQGALEGQLKNVGKGLWRYAPDGVPPLTIGQVFEIPLGYRTEIEVVGVLRTTQGLEYLCMTALGTVFKAIPIISLEHTLGLVPHVAEEGKVVYYAPKEDDREDITDPL